MNIVPAEIMDVLLIEPLVFEDDRGFFLRKLQPESLHRKAGVSVHFVQDNQSRSNHNVLRGSLPNPTASRQISPHHCRSHLSTSLSICEQARPPLVNRSATTSALKTNANSDTLICSRLS